MAGTETHEADEDARGRGADGPTRIPAQGWKDILLRVVSKISANRVMLVAAGVTFYALLALFPALTALVSIYGFVADPETVIEHSQALSRVMPEGAVGIIHGQLERIAGGPTGQLSLGFIIGLAIALWSTNTGVKAIMDSINVAYEEQESRGFIRLHLVSFLFTLGGIAFIILALTMIVVLPVVFSFLGLEGIGATLIQLLRWPVMLLVVIVALGILYRYGPSRQRAQWRWITPGASFAAIAWLVVSILFSWYVANFDTYNETYGSLGAVIAFMVWMWLSATVVITGALLDAEIEHQVEPDTTIGPDRPMGERGAVVADTLGKTADE